MRPLNDVALMAINRWVINNYLIIDAADTATLTTQTQITQQF